MRRLGALRHICDRLRKRSALHMLDALSVNENAAGGGGIYPVDALDESALACAVIAEHRHELTLLEVKRHIIEYLSAVF